MVKNTISSIQIINILIVFFYQRPLTFCDVPGEKFVSGINEGDPATPFCYYFDLQ